MFVLLSNVFTDILGILFGLFIVFPVGIFIFIYLPYTIIAKVFNVGFKTRNGSGYIDPNSLDNIIDLGKDLTTKASKEVSSIKNRLKDGSFNFGEDKKLTQIDKLTKLGELRRQNVISEKEFEDLKKEILR